jgi:hypothetical protein
MRVDGEEAEVAQDISLKNRYTKYQFHWTRSRWECYRTITVVFT